MKILVYPQDIELVLTKQQRFALRFQCKQNLF